MTTFVLVAFALLAGNAGGPLANAEATAPPEPVLGATEPVSQTEPAAPTETVASTEAAPPVTPAASTTEPVTPAPPPVATPAPDPAPPAAPPADSGSEPPAADPDPPGQGGPGDGGTDQGEEPAEEVPPAPPLGGGAKDDPSDPVEPEEPPTIDEPEPAPDPGPAPSGFRRRNLAGNPGEEPSGPAPSGAGKPDTEEPAIPLIPEPSGDSGDEQQPVVSAPPSTPVTIRLPVLVPVGSLGDQPIGDERGPNSRRPRPTQLFFSGGSGSNGATGGTGGTGTIGGTGGAGTGTGTGAGSLPGAALGASAPPLNVAAILSGGDDGGGGNAGNGSPGNDSLTNTEEVAETFGPVFADFADSLSFVPDTVKIALAALAALSIVLGLAYLLSTLRNRRLDRQRTELLKEVGLLQTALLPPVPEYVGSLRTSVAYRPADGPGAGGDFYDVLPLAAGRVGFVLGDVSGHGRGALARTAFMRYTLRAYLEAGLEPRVALQVAGRVIDENLGGDFATVLVAVHDPETGSLTYASAGHPAPIVVGPQPHEPVTAGSSPPIGVGVRTGLRQTTVPLVPGAVAAMFTDGLTEARVNGGILGRDRLETLLDDLGRDATAAGLIASVRQEARVLSDDIAAVVIQPTGGSTAGMFRTEQLELTTRELDEPMATRFLESCGVPSDEIEAAINDARGLAERFGGVILNVVFGNRLRVEVLPRNVESIEAASRRMSARP